MHKQTFKKFSWGRRAISTLLCASIALASLYFVFINQKAKERTDDFIGDMVGPNLRINSSNAILLNLDSNETLFSKNSTVKLYPASLTKIMTAVVALENLDDLNKRIVLNHEMYSEIYYENAMTAGFLPTEEVHAIDLLYGLILPSGAECALGLAASVAGTENIFVELMNNKALALGMSNTHFVNATGLHHENHYSTVNDMGILLKYALENDTFYKIFTTARYSSQPTNLHENGITFYSTLFSNAGNVDFNGGAILGGKTGYTDEAKKCLASLAKKNGNSYILVTCGAEETPNTQNPHIQDAFTVYNAIS